MTTATKNSKTTEYVDQFGSELAIALALQAKNKTAAALNRAIASHAQIRAMLRAADLDDEPIDHDLDAAFDVLRAGYDAEMQAHEAHLHDLFLLGRVAGAEPATDAHFSGLGLQRPNRDFLDRFFWEGD